MKNSFAIFAVIVAIVVVGVAYMGKRSPVDNYQNTEGMRHEKSMADALAVIMADQKVTAPLAIQCGMVSVEQFKELGDAVMGRLAGNETQHTKMEKMTGGEDAPATDSVHIAMGENYLGCNDAATPNENIMVMIRRDAQGAEYLTDAKRMALYTFVKDKPGMSTCTGKCAETWPPFFVPNKAIDASVVAGLGISGRPRPDLSLQFFWMGMPLYFYSGDKTAGQKTGEGIKDAWYTIEL